MIILSIGSNLKSNAGSKYQNIKKCIQLLSKNKVQPIKISHCYETPSYPNNKHPKFINVALIIKFIGTPQKLLKITNLIEKKMGRLKTSKNKPRIIDIDIIDYNKKIINTYNLVLPHPALKKRNFVLFPLKEILPGWEHPINNKKIDFYIKKLTLKQTNEITRINESGMFK